MSKLDDTLGVVLGLPGAVRTTGSRRSWSTLDNLRKFYTQRPRPWRPRRCAPKQPKLERMKLERRRQQERA